MGAPRTAGAGVYIWQDVIAELAYAARFRPDVYQTALLSGTQRVGGTGSAVLVQGFCELSSVAGPLAFAAELVSDWTMVVNRLRHASPALKLLGWVTVRRDSHGLLHDSEQFVHRTLFNLPHQLTVVLDPVHEKIGVWGADPQGFLVNLGFNLVVPQHDSTQAGVP
jgi:hypothetical protein